MMMNITKKFPGALVLLSLFLLPVVVQAYLTTDVAGTAMTTGWYFEYDQKWSPNDINSGPYTSASTCGVAEAQAIADTPAVRVLTSCYEHLGWVYDWVSPTHPNGPSGVFSSFSACQTAFLAPVPTGTSNGTPCHEATAAEVAASTPPISNTGGGSGSGSLSTGATQATFVPLAPLPGVDTSGDLIPYLISILQFLIGVAGLIAVIRLVICGFELLTAPGESQRSHAKECLWKVVLGLLLALSAFILLRSINPALTEPNLNLPATPSALAGSQNRPTAPGWYYSYVAARTGNTVYSGRSASEAECTTAQVDREGQGVTTGACFEVTAQVSGCTSCVNLTVNNKGPGPLRCNNCACSPSPSAPCQVSGSLNSKLNALQRIVPGWWVTESYPPTRQHQNLCHQAGTCVDADYTDNRSGATDVINFINAASSVGLRAVYEVSTEAEYNTLIGAGVPAANLWDGSGWINGNHFSVYDPTGGRN